MTPVCAIASERGEARLRARPSVPLKLTSGVFPRNSLRCTRDAIRPCDQAQRGAVQAMGRFATSPATHRRRCAQIPAASIADGILARLSCTSLMIGACALLSACGEPALVTVQMKLHKAPATQSEIVATVPAGSKVNASGCSNGWCWIKWNGQQGYALAKNLRTQGMRSGPPGENRDEEAEGPADAAAGGDDN